MKYFELVFLFLCSIIISFSTKAEQIPQNTLRMEAQEISPMTFYLNVSIENTPFATEKEDSVTKPTLYDTLTAEEINMLEVTIQNEVGSFSKEYKIYIAELIYNRLMSEEFPDTIKEVLFQEGQFQGINNWYYSGITPDEDTKAVIKKVFSTENPSHDCTYYYNPKLSESTAVIWFEYSGDVEYVFSHTEIDWGIEYETRFFR